MKAVSSTSRDEKQRGARVSAAKRRADTATGNTHADRNAHTDSGTMQSLADNSPVVERAAALQASATAHTAASTQGTVQAIANEKTESGTPGAGLPGRYDPVQRQMEEEEELLQGKSDTVQRQPEEEEELQGKFSGSPNTAQRAADEDRADNRTGMPDSLKQGIENLSGYAMDDVRVHYNSEKPATVQALAYAQGTDIHVGPGQERHLPHEAWHLVQQKQGRVAPTTQIAGKPVNDDPGLEREADVMGDRALQPKNAQTGLSSDVSDRER